MRERYRNLAVGVFSLGALAAAASLLFLFGELEPLVEKRWQMQVAFNEAGGLRKGSLVTLNGVPIGAVERVEIWSDRTQPVLVTFGVELAHRIPEPSTPSVQASLLGSGARLEISAALPLSDPPRFYPSDKPPILRGRVTPLETRLVEQLNERLEPVVKSFSDIGALARNLNDLVKPGAEGGAADPEGLRATLRRLNDTLASADAALKGARTWLDDEQLRTDVRDAAAGASILMRDAAEAANRIGALADSVANDAAQLRANALPVLDRAGHALEELNRLLADARTGDGTVGRMMKDPELYEGLADAAKRLDEALAKITLLIEKIRAEGVDVELFGSK